QVVDRVCFRPSYDARRVLEDASAALGSALDVELIAATVLAHADGALSVEAAAVYLETAGGTFQVAGGQGTPWGEAPPVAPDAPLVAELEAGRVVTWYADPDALGGPLPVGTVAAAIVVPVMHGERLNGFRVLAPGAAGKVLPAAD